MSIQKGLVWVHISQYLTFTLTMFVVVVGRMRVRVRDESLGGLLVDTGKVTFLCL